MNHDLITYYRDRAKEYEKIYTKPERQNDLKEATRTLQEYFAGKQVLEIACGTGYWTEKIADTATSVFATDINPSVIEQAKAKTWSHNNVTLEVADFYQLHPAQKYEAVFGGFIWSHILREDLDTFVRKLYDFVLPRGLVVFMDNRYVQGSSTPIAFTDTQGNTFQTRKLENGTEHQVLKNFPSEDFLKTKLENSFFHLQIINLEYYWIVAGERMN
ncbi:MAG: class I SAM-dependent methyltransferase [Bacteroidia bacterium]|nr:class I SAM-dependent methyltransferase [Bacteroidia bacterium]